MTRKSAMERVRQGWGEDPPEWIVALAEACDREASQAAVGDQIGYSAAVVNTVLANTYRGDMGRVEAAVRGAYLRETVECPVLGEIPTSTCIAHQRQPFVAGNHLQVRIYRACRAGCPHSRLGGADGDD